MEGHEATENLFENVGGVERDQDQIGRDRPRFGGPVGEVYGPGLSAGMVTDSGAAGNRGLYGGRGTG
jgi:hypothetical protein